MSKPLPSLASGWGPRARNSAVLRRLLTGHGMQIRYKVALVGGIPILMAASITLAAWLLLQEADRARSGAVLASSAYRDLAGLMTARDEYVRVPVRGREREAARFTEAANRAQTRLGALAELAREDVQRNATRITESALKRYREQMATLRGTTERNDTLVSEMNARAASLIALTERARERQHASNADIITSITEDDRKLRLARDLVDLAQDLRGLILSGRLNQAGRRQAESSLAYEQRLRADSVQIANTARGLVVKLREAQRQSQADELVILAGAAATVIRTDASAAGDAVIDGLTDWIDRLIKIHASEARSLQEEAGQLLTYSIAAAETEQATQNIATSTLAVGSRTAEALGLRDVASVDRILEEVKALAATMASLPISALIQTEMIDAFDQWRQRLATTNRGLREQNGIMSDMDASATAMIGGASALNDRFTGDAERIGDFIRTILITGAAGGLLFGSLAAYVVARSITRPLKNLEDEMIELAADPTRGPISDARRRDELGAMARAANFFVTEIGRREQALRLSKDRADTALDELRQTQASLIQSEKLASLGQLVAGVAHEINTPLGIALTTSTAFGSEVEKLRRGSENGQLLRSDLTRIVERLQEGSRLVLSNLTRAIDLVYSFKQVAADQASGGFRQFEMRGWVHEVLTSLGPVLRKAGHQVDVECSDDIVMESYPGALAQVITNLVTNAVGHAYAPGQSGRLRLTITSPQGGMARIVFCDDGRGIAKRNLVKVFDPFFTTGRSRGNTGLGLHIVHNLVTLTLAGRISVESAPGEGTCFTIDVPTTLTRDDAAEPAPAGERMLS